MKNLLFIFFLIPLFSIAQIEKTIKLKVAVMQNFVSKPGDEGQIMFWQTKGKITYGIVSYTEEQNYLFKEMFIKQYSELQKIYMKMIGSEDEKDTDLYIQTLIRQEEDYRKSLTTEQLKKYRETLANFEKNSPQQHDSYSSLFFSDNLLKEYKDKFQYK